MLSCVFCTGTDNANPKFYSIVERKANLVPDRMNHAVFENVVDLG